MGNRVKGIRHVKKSRTGSLVRPGFSYIQLLMGSTRVNIAAVYRLILTRTILGARPPSRHVFIQKGGGMTCADTALLPC